MDEPIPVTSADDPRVDDYRDLHDRTARQRIERDEFFISEGWVSIERLIDSGHVFRSALLSPSRVNRFRPHLEHLALAGTPVYVAERDVMSAIVGFDLPRGVHVSAARRPHPSLDELASNSTRLAVLDGLDDDESVGAIARAARAFGIDGLVLGPGCTDPYHRRIVRVSMGEILLLPVTQCTPAEWPHVVDVLTSRGFMTWAITADRAAVSLWDADVPERLAVTLGAAGRSLPRHLLDCGLPVTIPTRPGVGAMNVGQAAAIAFSAISRGSRR